MDLVWSQKVRKKVMDTCVIWIHHYYVRRDETCFLKLQLARVCFFYTHISFHRNWSDFSQALSKARDTKQINVSEVIIYQKPFLSLLLVLRDRKAHNRLGFSARWLQSSKYNYIKLSTQYFWGNYVKVDIHSGSFW